VTDVLMPDTHHALLHSTPTIATIRAALLGDGGSFATKAVPPRQLLMT
jgi:hypothetical protein